MATLVEQERATISAEVQRVRGLVAGALSKADLRAAVDAIDDWVDANAASFNAAIPQPARAALSAQQKAALLHWVVQRRFEVS